VNVSESSDPERPNNVCVAVCVSVTKPRIFQHGSIHE